MVGSTMDKVDKILLLSFNAPACLPEIPGSGGKCNSG